MSDNVVAIDSANGASRLTLSFDEPQPILRLFRSSSSLPSETEEQVSALEDSATSQVCVLTTRLTSLGVYTPNCLTVDKGSRKYMITFSESKSHVSITAHDNCFSISVMSASFDIVQADFDMHPASWFGYGPLLYHHWPLDEASMILSPTYPFDTCPTGNSTLLDPTFMSSSGVLLSLLEDSPCLHVAINAPKTPVKKPFVWSVGLANINMEVLPEKVEHLTPRTLTAQSRKAFDDPQVKHPWSDFRIAADKNPELKFSLRATSNVRDATLAYLSQTLASQGSPACCEQKRHMMQSPIWSTWAQFKRDITQDKILSFAEEIKNRGLERSVMGIDDKWSSVYGEIEFDPVKFPNPTKMVSKLHDMGYMVTLWVTPFASIDAAPTKDPKTKQYYVSMPDGTLGEFHWWQPGRAVALDVTNLDACSWFVSKLQKLCDDHGIDGYKFDAGEPCFLSSGCTLQESMDCPTDYTRLWIQNVASKFPISEVRSGSRGCQSASPMFRIFDKYSTWGSGNGLESVITAVLTSGILGFPFCLPDYVAGNAYGDEVPNAELMVRWTQASVAMAAIQFSIPPWHFSTDTETWCETYVYKALKWRKNLFWPHVKLNIDDARSKLWPIVRPMWWEEPDLKDVQCIHDQFMLGDNLVVAPVIKQGQTERAVFIPRGVWKKINMDSCQPDEQTERITGPVWLENVSAPLDDMPVYIRVSTAEEDRVITPPLAVTTN